LKSFKWVANGACMVFRQVLMRGLQDAVGAGEDLDMRGFCDITC